VEGLKNININLAKLVGKQILLAHSGGLDSSVMADLLVKAKVPFSVAHCNFQLRGEESNSDAGLVKAWCFDNSIPFFSVEFATLEYKKYHKKSTQLAARDLRYSWFDDIMDGYAFDFLVTAHHLNDQLETFLINTTRGTGVSGLLGIQEREHLLRPLRSIPKKELIQYAKEHGVIWNEDSSNASDDYLRNEVRHHVIPIIEDIVPNALHNFQSTLDHLLLTNDFIQTSLETLKQKLFIIEKEHIKIEIKGLLKLPSLLFCVHHLFSPYGFNSKEVVKLLNSESGKILYSETHRLIRDRSFLILIEKRLEEEQIILFDPNNPSSNLPINLKCEHLVNIDSRSWRPNQAALDQKLIKKHLFLRKFKKGDYFYPAGMKGKKLLSKFFKDEKYSLLEKEQQWLLCSDDQIVWVVGKRCDRRYIMNDNTETILLIYVI